LASISTQRCGSSAAICRQASRRPDELQIFRLEPVRHAAAAASGRAQTDFNRNVQNDGQVRLEIADRDALHGVERLARPPQAALIGAVESEVSHNT
jgi:hypothetical protein